MNNQSAQPNPLKQLARALGLASVLAWANVASAASSVVVANPSFEADNFATFPGYVSGNGPITGWNALGGHGVNPGTFGGPFTDNGAFPDGTKAAFLQEAGALRQTISGFNIGATYAIQYSENARNCCGGTPSCEVKVGGTTVVVAHAVTPVGGSNPYGLVTSAPFVATAATLELAFIKGEAVAGDATLLIDNVLILDVSAVPVVANPSFEADNFTVFPGYVSGNGPITGWTSLDNHGVNPGTFGGPFTDNGAIPDGTKAAFLQGDGALSQVVSGFSVGATYQIRYSENSRNCCTAGAAPTVEVKVGGVTVAAAHSVPPVGGSNPYRQVFTDPFVATAASLEIAFIKGSPAGADTTLLIDDVSILVRARVPGLYNSGVDNNGVALADGAVDPHWQLAVNADGPSHDAIVHSSTVFPIVAGPWLANNGSSKWISPRLDSAGAAGEDKGNYVYRASFDLTGIDRNSLTISGDWAVDNVGVAIRVNGTVTGQVNNNGFAGLTSFTINSQNASFVDGANTIEFEVLNAGVAPGWTGLRLANVRGLADLAGTPPRIVTQPQGGLIGTGNSFTFSVIAAGSSPLAYEWRKNGTPIPGQTSPSLTIVNAVVTDGGAYSVKVSNAVADVVSADAVLEVRSSVPGIYDTGVDDNKVALADGASDTHYKLVLNPDNTGETPVVEDSSVFPIVTGPWVANTATSKWIGPRFETSGSAGAEGDGGNYTYRVAIDLTGYNPASVVVLGDWATDNAGLDITINGQATGQQNTTQFGGYTPFTISSGFIAGVNQIEFKLNNSAVGYTGLRVRNLRALGDLGQVCPQAQSQTVTLNEDSTAPIILGATDANGDALTLSIVSPPAHGTLSGTPPNVTYSPARDYCGPDSFTFKANDGQCDSAVAQVSINVTCTNDNPIARIVVTPSVDLGTPSPNIIVLSINNSNACVVLDGSASSDAEPGPLDFDWFVDGVPAGSGATVPVCLELGIHQVMLTVSDNDGGTGTGTVGVEVITGSEAIDELIEQVNNSDLGRKNKRPFIATLKAVSASFDRGSIESALGQLHAFQNKVRAQVGPIDPALAAQWIRSAQSIIDAVEAQQ